MDLQGFENRKADHIRLALQEENQAQGQHGFDRIHLNHDAFPEINYSEVATTTEFWGYEASSPCFLSSMTAGHHHGEAVNHTLAKVAGEKRWPMGVGSQRRELSDPEAGQEWKRLRQLAPSTLFFSNLGLSQLVHTPVEKVIRLVENLESAALIIHTNPLQEALQREGTPHFAGGYAALERLCSRSPVPVIVKETGCGFTASTVQRVLETGVSALDVSGLGGTHWGRIEGGRAESESLQARAAATFADWGESTVDSLFAARTLCGSFGAELWASGGVRSGLDAAKAIAIGANKVGFAKPALQAALEGEKTLQQWMDLIEYELKIALFCTGCRIPGELGRESKWRKI